LLSIIEQVHGIAASVHVANNTATISPTQLVQLNTQGLYRHQNTVFQNFSGTWTIRTLDYSYPGLFVPSMDYSYPGLFVPSWTVRTMDGSYHPWTFRTLDESYVGLFVPCTGWFYHVEN